MKLRPCFALLTLLVAALPAVADVKLPALFSSHMVLQQGTPVPVWGRADPGERVTVAVRSGAGDVENRVTTLAGAGGRWRVTLEPLKAGGPVSLIVKGKNTLTLENVLVGEVWICSGQSNMAWQVRQSRNPEQEIAGAVFPEIRLFTVKHTVSRREKADCSGQWAVCSPATVPGFSAVGYFFGREVYRALKVPIGLIHTSWGGTPAEAWTRREALQRHAHLRPILQRFDKAVAGYPAALKKHEKRLAAWKAKAAKARSAGKRPPRRPRGPFGPGHPHSPSGLFNGMIAPLIPYAFRGVIWYQGESNATRAFQYRTLFKAMIRDWRRAWGQGDFPFLFVQLANFKARQSAPGESAWAELREAQALALELPCTGMALAIDIGEARDIHPRNKQEVGRRLALQALSAAYGRKGVHSGPVFHGMQRKSGKIHVRFLSPGKGLTVRGKALEGFQIAGSDRKYVWARAALDPKQRDRVVVWSPEVKAPVHVRYAWADNPACSLYNVAGLPAVPFRTDAWPGVTDKNR